MSVFFLSPPGDSNVQPMLRIPGLDYMPCEDRPVPNTWQFNKYLFHAKLPAGEVVESYIVRFSFSGVQIATLAECFESSESCGCLQRM